jgi:hypothetical protein
MGLAAAKTGDSAAAEAQWAAIRPAISRASGLPIRIYRLAEELAMAVGKTV